MNMKTKGTILRRNISGKEYYYHKYLLGGKQVNEILTEEEAYGMAFKLNFKGDDIAEFLNHDFNLNIAYGEMLYKLGKPYRGYEKRFCYADIDDFLNNSYPGKVLALFGLRRTGKTTLMLQSINGFSMKQFGQTAYIKCNNGETVYQLLEDLKYLTNNGFNYIFIDEVTQLEDFVKLSSTISDIYGLMAKIVLSGADSLGFLIASYHELYDRIKMVHTTYISFKEFSHVLGIQSIDQYIEYGGTMSLEGVDYNKTIGVGAYSINEYVDSSIIHNIIHSLKSVDNGKYFFHLFELYERNELENVINRIIEDANHRFAISVIEQDFKSHDYGSLKQLLSLPRNYEKFGTVLDGVNEKKLVDDLMDALNIINKEKQTYQVDQDVLLELEEYLKRVDVIAEVDEVIYPSYSTRKRIIFTQPGLRYSQAKTLVEILLNDPKLKQYDNKIISAVREKLLSDVKGKMVEDIILYDATLKNENTFKMYFGIEGEFDMAMLFPNENYADIFEIKYSTAVDKNQYKHLINPKLIQLFEEKYDSIKCRTVLYRGEDTETEEGIIYQNIEEYLQR